MSENLSVTDRAARLLQIRPGEGRAVIWSCLYIFCVLSAYYVIRPIRDNMGIAGGVRNLQWLFSATLVCMLLANLPFAALSRRLPRVRFISISYRFFIANLAIFAVLLSLGSSSQHTWVGRVFFVWVSVFNLFVVSVFWALVVDVFDGEQGKRLFSILAAAATVGAVVGSSVTALLAHAVGEVGLLVVSAILLEVSVICVRRLSRLASQKSPSDAAISSGSTAVATPAVDAATQPLGGGWLTGVTHTLKSGYLANICLYMLLFAVATTILYFEQANLVRRYFPDSAARVTFFATLDLISNVLTLAVQLTITSRIIKRFGLTLSLVLIPVLSVFGFAFLAIWPSIAILVGFAVLRRAGNFAIARPSREILFTAVSREDKYKAKSFIDTVVYRLGDQLGAWTYAAFESIQLSAGGMAWIAAILSLAWCVNTGWLGRRHSHIVRSAQ